MPRPKKPRLVSECPSLTSFIPEGASISGEVFLSVEELEAIRLSDVERLDQESAAGLMQVSRQTYGRVLASARGVIGEALITGKALRIEGGAYEMRGRRHRRRRRRATGTAPIETLSGKGLDTMPGYDGRWPQGQRPGSGNRRERCSAPAQNGQARMGPGSRTGQGRGRGKGRNFGNGGGKRR